MYSSRAILASVVVGSALLLSGPAFAQAPAVPAGAPETAPVTSPVAAPAATAAPALQGLWLTTAFPSLTERVGDDIRLDLSLQNKDRPPQRVELAVTGLPSGWSYEFDGGGKPVTAAIVQPDSTQSLALKITPPKDVKTGTYEFAVSGKADATSLNLPLTLALAEAKPATVTVTPKLPALRGTPTSAFDFDVDIKNDGAEDQTFNLLSQGPPGFEITFKEQYGTQELTSVPIKAGETKSLKVSVKLPQDIAAGRYTVAVQAAGPQANGQSPLLLDVTGQPKLLLAGPEGRLSGDATAGKPRTFKFTVKNDGTAPAKAVSVNASAPAEWKAEADPKTIEEIAPGDTVPVDIDITPSDKAIAGDYVMNVSASGDGASDSASFRVTVLTSTLWGIAGLLVIAAAVLVLAGAVTRYGRR
jgi:uncharacterized membrane protein